MHILDVLKGTASASSLPDAQRRMYESETTENFRLVAKLFARASSYTLTSVDFAPIDLQVELSEIGQFAEVAHGKLRQGFIWKNLEKLSQPDFPLNRYGALEGSELLSTFKGTIAELPGYIAYRPHLAQLVVAFSGTSSFAQTCRNIDVRAVTYPSRNNCTVHSGFWQLYGGIRSLALDGLTKALSDHHVTEIVLTGHSLGGAMCYLLALELLGNSPGSDGCRQLSLPLKLAVFGSPRVGNQALIQYWRDLVANQISRGFSVTEYSVRAYNDGVPSIPPYSLGYRHFSKTPLYHAQGCLYNIPAAESEYTKFSVAPHDPNSSREQFLEHPLGGHNYYNNRDMEKLLRRMSWFNSMESLTVDWESYHSWLRDEARREEGLPST